MKPMKKTITGWVGKNELADKRWRELVFTMPIAARTKGKKEEWCEKEWPPVKVRVTIEVIE